jgi:hypothetical protein
LQRFLLPELKPAHVYEVRPRKDRRGFDLISDALPFGRFWYAEPNAVNNAVGHKGASFPPRSGVAVLCNLWLTFGKIGRAGLLCLA